MIDWADFCINTDPWQGEVPKPASSMIYTSGTTGNPKGVLRLGKVKPNKFGYNTIFDKNVRMLLPTPAYHSAPNRLLKLPKEVRSKYDPSSLEHIVCAGAPFPQDIKTAMIDWWGPVLFEFYGSTETSALTYCNSHEALEKPGTVGRAVEDAVIKIFDADGQQCPPYAKGEIFGKLKELPDFTYLKRPKDRLAVEKDGLITSGDIGYFDDDGYLFLSDRKNDMVISGGVNIYPAHIEAALFGFDGILDCAVFGVPHPDMGEALVAAIQMEPGRVLDEDALRAYLGKKIAKYMIPTQIFEDPNLPRDDSGKIFKRKLRDAYWNKSGRNI
ncbi:MAG: hypothetical protein COA78_15640 [Blastopirellula sp.]|nr:MAG: hypothetical protein COA78_15640 [Blastopirellula sp.]